MYPPTAFSVGTACPESSAKLSSAENSLIVTPFLNPNALAFERPISPANVISPVAWSTLKNLPTRKKPV